MTTLTDAIQKLMGGESLSRGEAREVFGALMKGEATPVQIAALLTALRVKGETVEEITGATEAMRAAAIPVRHENRLVVDTCGTGGDGMGSFNVSTTAAFVVAGAGLTVAKHGNRSISSRCGSADVLEILGIPVQTNVETVELCLQKIGLAFIFAPAFHPAMKFAMPVRKELGVRTIFNLLGPLTNPARPDVQLIGVFDDHWVKPLGEVLIHLGMTDGLVVHGQGNDEIVLSGPTQVAAIEKGGLQMGEWRPEDFGLTTQSGEHLPGGSPRENAALLVRILEGEKGPFREAVCMNAAALIQAAYRSPRAKKQSTSLREAYKLAEKSIDSQAAFGKLQALKGALSSAAKQ